MAIQYNIVNCPLEDNSIDIAGGHSSSSTNVAYNGSEALYVSTSRITVDSVSNVRYEEQGIYKEHIGWEIQFSYRQNRNQDRVDIWSYSIFTAYYIISTGTLTIVCSSSPSITFELQGYLKPNTYYHLIFSRAHYSCGWSSCGSIHLWFNGIHSLIYGGASGAQFITNTVYLGKCSSDEAALLGTMKDFKFWVGDITETEVATKFAALDYKPGFYCFMPSKVTCIGTVDNPMLNSSSITAESIIIASCTFITRGERMAMLNFTSGNSVEEELLLKAEDIEPYFNINGGLKCIADKK